LDDTHLSASQAHPEALTVDEEESAKCFVDSGEPGEGQRWADRRDSRTNSSWRTKIKLWDKMRALEALAKHFGLVKDRIEVTGWDKLAAQLNHARTVGPTALT
jgi:hypothetical protein